MLDAAGAGAVDGVIDVGGGASRLVDALLARGRADLTELDISCAALQISRERLGAEAARVDWLVADVRSWRAARTYRVWHDRAVLHFLTDETSRQRYRHALAGATGPGSVAVIATFAPDGPTHCSGFPVCRYGAGELSEFLGERWQLTVRRREEHRTPAGAVQPFTWAAFRHV